MTKSELINSISTLYPSMKISDIKKLVEVIFKQMSDALIEGKRIELRGFCSMSVRERQEKDVRNPKTNEKISLAKKRSVYFRIGKNFFEKLNHCNTNDK